MIVYDSYELWTMNKLNSIPMKYLDGTWDATLQKHPETAETGQHHGLEPRFGLAVNTHRSSFWTSRMSSAASFARNAYITTGQMTKRKPTHMVQAAQCIDILDTLSRHNTMHCGRLRTQNVRVHDFTTAEAGIICLANTYKGSPANLDFFTKSSS